MWKGAIHGVHTWDINVNDSDILLLGGIQKGYLACMHRKEFFGLGLWTRLWTRLGIGIGTWVSLGLGLGLGGIHPYICGLRSEDCRVNKHGYRASIRNQKSDHREQSSCHTPTRIHT